MLFDDLKKANMMAMKEHNQPARSALSTVISKCMLLSVEKKAKQQSLTDEDTLSLIQKTIKELEEEKTSFEKANRAEQVEDLKKQIEVINTYLPKQLTLEEIKSVISGLKDKTMPEIMKYFKENYAGRCDMRLVSSLAKSAS